MGKVEFSTEYDGGNSIVRHKVWGLHNTPEDAHPSIGEAMALARTKNCRNVLFDLSGLQFDVTPVATLNLTSDFERAGLHRGIRCAVCVRERSEEHELMESLAVRRGCNIRLFVDQATAVQWLTT